MIVFNTDLDNTIIFSYKHDIGNDKRNVEIYEGREISFITQKTYKLLQRVKEEVLLVPTTTRTTEQYERIDLGIGIPQYALTYNGGVLLIDGKENEDWYQESLRLVESSKGELEKSVELLEKEERRTLEVRNLKGLFIYTKCDEPEQVIAELKTKLDTSIVDVFNNGVKVYVVPKTLTKGVAITRFKEYVKADKIIAAGDSEFDVEMFKVADVSIAPKKLSKTHELAKGTIVMPEEKVFSEEVLEYVLDNSALL